MQYQQFYSELGKLLYAIAYIDGNISPKEKEKFNKIVREELLPLEGSTDKFKTDAAYYTKFEFDILEENIAEPETAFESFINYIEDHKTAIDRKMILAVRLSALELADTFYHTNKKEKELLKRLGNQLDKLLK